MRVLTETCNRLATQEQMDELLKTAKHLEQMIKQAGKKKERLPSEIRLPGCTRLFRNGIGRQWSRCDGAGYGTLLLLWFVGRRLSNSVSCAGDGQHHAASPHDSKSAPQGEGKKSPSVITRKTMRTNKPIPGSRPCNGLLFLLPEVVSGERTYMKSEFELYMETGMVGAYQPEMAVLRKEPDGVLAVYRDTVFEQEDDGMTCKRFMMVGDALASPLYFRTQHLLTQHRNICPTSTASFPKKHTAPE